MEQQREQGDAEIERTVPLAPLRSRLVIVFAVALALRAGWGTYRMSTAGADALEFPDEQQYWSMAVSVSEGTGLRDELGHRAGRMPLYPGLLSTVAGWEHGRAAVRVGQWVAGALGAGLVLVLGTRIAGRTVGTLAGLVVAADPFLIFFSNLLLTETLFVTLLVGLWSCAAQFVIRRREPAVGQWFVIGVLSLACVYARESTLGLIALGLLVFLVRRRFSRAAGAGALIVAGVLVIGLFPWVWRNQATIGEWCWLTTRAGISLYDGVGPQATGASNLGDIKDSEAVRGLSEAAYNRYFLTAALDRIRSDPGGVVGLAGRKFARMWNPVPNVAEYQSHGVRWISAGWMVPLLVLALTGLWVLRGSLPAGGRAAAVFLLLPAIYFTMLHMVFVGSVRYRLGAVPMLAVLAAIALERALRGIKRRGDHPAPSPRPAPPGPPE